jgi:hypothetical protein
MRQMKTYKLGIVSCTNPVYEIGEMIRWPKHRGGNLVRGIILEDKVTHYLVKDRTGKKTLAWKGCICPMPKSDTDYNAAHGFNR